MVKLIDNIFLEFFGWNLVDVLLLLYSLKKV